METNVPYNRGPQMPESPKQSFRLDGKILSGLIVVLVGVAFLLDNLDFPIPRWIFSWQMLLIAIGLFNGARNSFKGWGWLIPVAIGLFFLADDFIYGYSFHQFFWPVVIISIGLYMIFRPRKKKENFWTSANSHEDEINAASVFGGIKKNIISKDFTGGEINALFGGMELNLSQADINGTAILNVHCMFGGVKLIIPSNWQVNSEKLVAILGGIEDKRIMQPAPASEIKKVLILQGSVLFGGIEMKSF